MVDGGAARAGDEARPSTRVRSVLLVYARAGFLWSAALAVGLGAHHYRIGHQSALFLLAITVACWNGGFGPALLTALASSLAYDYFFTPPVGVFWVSKFDLLDFLLYLVFAVLISRFRAVRVRADEALRASHAELERRVAERTRELEALNKELESFAYSVSHDLRAPVRHVAAFTELLQKHAGDVLDDRGRRHASMILEAANRMGSLIDDLLAFSRISRAEARKTMVDLGAIAGRVVKEAGVDTQGRTVLWKVGPLPKCEADPAMVHVLFTNLISNAVKFTRTRERAEIETGVLHDSPGEFTLFVRDNGVGFDMKYKDKLFGVFQRLHSQDAFEGTGIGLATVQRIVHRHGGRVWAEGEIDKGATFFVALPRMAAPALTAGDTRGGLA